MKYKMDRYEEFSLTSCRARILELEDELAAIGRHSIKQQDRIQTLDSTLRKIEECYDGLVNVVPNVKCIRCGHLESVIREIADGFLPDGTYAGRPLCEMAPELCSPASGGTAE
jgi:hypothetical protein